MYIGTSPHQPHLLLKLALIFLGAFTLALVDFVLEVPTRSASHMTAHAISILLFLWGTVSLARGWVATREELSGSRGAVRDLSTERDNWRERAKQFQEGLGQAIDDQMNAWELTETEKATALMLLKGYSHKEVAQYVDRSERTIRQHAVAVYRKSGLHGRAEFAAFFLEDLLAPASGSSSES